MQIKHLKIIYVIK